MDSHNKDTNKNSTYMLLTSKTGIWPHLKCTIKTMKMQMHMCYVRKVLVVHVDDEDADIDEECYIQKMWTKMQRQMRSVIYDSHDEDADADED